MSASARNRHERERRRREPPTTPRAQRRERKIARVKTARTIRRLVPRLDSYSRARDNRGVARYEILTGTTPSPHSDTGLVGSTQIQQTAPSRNSTPVT